MSGFTGGRIGSVIANIQVTNAVPGDVLVFDGSNWVNSGTLPTPTTVSVVPGDLTGDGSTLSPLGLANSGVVPGSYTYAGINVDAKGRVTAAISGATPLTSVAHDATLAGDGTVGNPLTVVPGAITPTTVQTDNVTTEGDGSLATPIKLKQVQVASNLSGNGTVGVPLDLANTAVTPGSYTNTNITVDAKGRITSASNGAGGALTSVAVDANDLTGDGTMGNPLALAINGPGAVMLYGPRTETDTKGRVATMQAPSTLSDITRRGNYGSFSSGSNADLVYFPIGGTQPTALTPTVNTWTGNAYLDVNVPGLYSFHCTLDFAPNATGYRQCQIVWTRSGTTMVVAENANFNVGVSFRTAVSSSCSLYLSAGDRVYTRGYQNSGSGLNLTCWISGVLVHS